MSESVTVGNSSRLDVTELSPTPTHTPNTKTNSKRITIVITPVATEVVQYDTSVHVKKDKRKSRSEKFTVFQSHESRRHATLGIIIVPYSSSLLPLRCQSRKEGRSLGLTFSLKFLSTDLMGMGFIFKTKGTRKRLNNRLTANDLRNDVKMNITTSHLQTKHLNYLLLLFFLVTFSFLFLIVQLL